MAAYEHWVVNEHGALVELADTATPPAKDFFQIYMTPDEIVYRLWKIVPPTRPNNHPQPVEIRDSIEDFKADERLHSEIQRVAGENMVNYLLGIADGRLDFISRINKKLVNRIIRMLDLESIARLSQTCKHFRKLCNSDEIWEKIYKTHNRQPITPELLMLVDRKGWKDVFFTNKLQLQMQMRRIASPGGNAAFLTEQGEQQQQH